MKTQKPSSSHFLMGRSILYSVIHFFSLDSSLFVLKSCLLQRNSRCQVSITWNLQDYDTICSFPLPLYAIRAHTLYCNSITV